MMRKHLRRGFDGAPNVSRTVGWASRRVPWPKPEEVEAAIAAQDAVQLLTWRRFLRLAETEQQLQIIARITEVEPDIRAAAEMLARTRPVR